MIREVTLADAPCLLEIYAYYVRETAVSFEVTVPSLDEFRDRIARITARYPYLVAEEDGRVLGYAYAGTFKPREAYDRCCELSIYLARDARRRGLGRQLYTALENELKAMNLLNLYTCIGVPEQEDEYLTLDSVRFHTRMGFAEVGRFRRCGYKFGRWYDMVWMEKIVGPHPAVPTPVLWRQNIADANG